MVSAVQPLPHLTVLENIKLAQVIVRKQRGDAAQVAMDLLKVAYLTKATNFPGQLSGGQRQRVAIARAQR